MRRVGNDRHIYFKVTVMIEIEQLNEISNKASELINRLNEIRGYL
jgi:hypothetical protein